QYFFGTHIASDWQVGSQVTYSRNGEVTDYGEILRCEKPRVLSFTWTHTGDKTERSGPTVLTFELKPVEGAVRLTVKHENLAPQDIVDDPETFEGLNNGWPAILSNLKSLLETGKTIPALSL
ncbi:MAG TPA: SRPBCC domain-containing protein, partial [Bacillales bacterium]|nr:SRPBCC domain-containing protein [Bacillales bacterium]